MATALPDMLAGAMDRLNLPESERPIVRRVFREAARGFDYEEFGGAPLLGVSGSVVIGHGGSSARAIERMIRAGADLARERVADAIGAAMGPAAGVGA